MSSPLTLPPGTANPSRVRPRFAVVREDPDLEAELVRRSAAQNILVVASGGCTALTLAQRFPTLQITAFDLNPQQLRQVQDKAAAVTRGDRAALDVMSTTPGLNQDGEFEGLFRTLRTFLMEFITSPEELLHFFRTASAAKRLTLLDRWTRSPYWPVAFTLTFHADFLNAMFGPDATRHALPGSYPGYFRAAFERGLYRADAAHNPFLQHVFLGYYLPDDAPDYVGAGRALEVTLFQGTMTAVPDLEKYQVYSLSNIFDWSDDELVASWAAALGRAARPGAMVLLRQLNNERPLHRFFSPWFTFDETLGADFLQRDRSLFYNRILVAVRSMAPA